MAMEENGETDIRPEWLDERVASTLGVNRGSFKEVLESSDGSGAISNSFLNDEEQIRLIVYLGPKGSIIAVSAQQVRTLCLLKRRSPFVVDF